MTQKEIQQLFDRMIREITSAYEEIPYDEKDMVGEDIEDYRDYRTEQLDSMKNHLENVLEWVQELLTEE